MNSNLIYLDSYILQQDMRVRLPKSIIENLQVEKGKTRFSILLDKENDRIILEVENHETTQE